jgi:hypothetical protein
VLPLAFGAKVSSTSGYKDASYGGFALAAWLPCALVNAVLQLKKAACAIGIDVVGDRGATEPNGVPKNLAQRLPEPVVLGNRDPVGAPSRPDSGMEQAFVRIDVPHTRQQRLIEQRRFDGHMPCAKECCKLTGADVERIGSRTLKSAVPHQVSEL